MGIQLPLEMQPFKVSQLGFESCQTTYGSPIVSRPTGDPITVDDSHLSQGQNLFIVGSDSPLFQCQFGLRLNVTVKANRCNPPDKPNTPCYDHGTCLSSITEDAYACRCCLGYSGQFCEEYDGCLENECSVSSNCVDVIQGYEGQDYQCICPNGRSGPRCDIDVNECGSNPCVNGICKITMDGTNAIVNQVIQERIVSCNTTNAFPILAQRRSVRGRTKQLPVPLSGGYFGVHCEMKRNFCESNPCHNASMCVDETYSYRCICEAGFTGADCASNINECESSPCENEATCMDLVAGYHCQCTEEYTGVHCQDVAPLIFTAPDRSQYFIAIGLLASALATSFGLIAACGCWVQKARGPRKIEPGGYFDDEDSLLSGIHVTYVLHLARVTERGDRIPHLRYVSSSQSM
ncbi:putative fibropellin-3 [Apostichopus japonicus]|uniref:Putative fibropellin-3 n=1 Tax=Stichopus japonicus TaxID=307972 RepID=A0A2G8L5Y1_STIJA|nr:putative fibropellin-3 [Apostichopus japonicus]